MSFDPSHSCQMILKLCIEMWTTLYSHHRQVRTESWTKTTTTCREGFREYALHESELIILERIIHLLPNMLCRQTSMCMCIMNISLLLRKIITVNIESMTM